MHIHRLSSLFVLLSTALTLVVADEHDHKVRLHSKRTSTCIPSSVCVHPSMKMAVKSFYGWIRWGHTTIDKRRTIISPCRSAVVVAPFHIIMKRWVRTFSASNWSTVAWRSISNVSSTLLPSLTSHLFARFFAHGTDQTIRRKLRSARSQLYLNRTILSPMPLRITIGIRCSLMICRSGVSRATTIVRSDDAWIWNRHSWWNGW